MLNYSSNDIDRLQEHLQIIRRAGGWTAEEFGELIGVTKQTISNLENKRTPLTKTQYIAIRAVLDYETKNNPDNAALGQIIGILLDGEGLGKEDVEKAKSAAVYISGAKRTGLDSNTILSAIAALLGAIITASSATSGSGSWLSKLIGKGR